MVFRAIHQVKFDNVDPELAELEAELNRHGLSLNLTDDPEQAQTMVPPDSQASGQIVGQSVGQPVGLSAGQPIMTAESIAEEIFAQANKNTERAYNSALKPLLHWLETNNQYTGLGRMAINEEKLLVYLRTCVVGRESKKSKGKVIGFKSIQNVERCREFMDASSYGYSKLVSINFNE